MEVRIFFESLLYKSFRKTSFLFAAFIINVASGFLVQRLEYQLVTLEIGVQLPLEAAIAPYGLKDRTNQASEATVMLKPISLLIKVNPPLCRKTNIFVELIFRQIICRLSLQVKQLHTIERYQPSLVDMLMWRNRQTHGTLMYFTHNLMSAVIFHRECLKGNLQSRSWLKRRRQIQNAVLVHQDECREHTPTA